MLIFTYKLEKYIKNKLFPKILLDPRTYVIKGSFRRRIPYVTDVDVVNNVYPTINENNIYSELIKLIRRLENQSDIILVYVTCGTDDRFKIVTGSDEELEKIKSLLDTKDATLFDLILKKYANNFNKKIFFANEMVWEYYKLRWTPTEVMADKKLLADGVIVKLSEIVKDNTSLLLQYFVKIGSYPVGIDVVVNYKPVDLTAAYKSAGDYQLKLANYSNEYYYMLFPFRHYFKQNWDIVNELNDLIDKKLGLYKQLMVRIDTYTTLYNTNNLNIRTATDIVTSIIKDTEKLPGFTSSTIDLIRKIAINNPPDVKMKEWNILITVLYDEIDAAVNVIAKDYFFKYLEMLPEDIRKQYYLVDNNQSRIVRKRYSKLY